MKNQTEEKVVTKFTPSRKPKIFILGQQNKFVKPILPKKNK